MAICAVALVRMHCTRVGHVLYCLRPRFLMPVAGKLIVCIGYRPIFAAMQSFAATGETDEVLITFALPRLIVIQLNVDLEDMHLLKQGPCTSLPCGKYCDRKVGCSHSALNVLRNVLKLHASNINRQS